MTGSKDSRPALNRLMIDAQRRKFDAVLVWKLDRFGRSLRHLVNALAELEALGLTFISLRDNLDLSTPSGRLMFQIIGAMAEFERALIQERVRAGLRNARAKGRRLGRPRVIVDASREVELTFDRPPLSPEPLPGTWMQVSTSASVLRFTESRFNEERTTADIRRSFGDVRNVTFTPMSLRSIFLAMAKTGRDSA